MRSIVIVAVVGLLAVGLIGCGRYISPTALDVMQRSTREKDAVVLLPVPDDPTISFRVWFKVGSQNDPPGKQGLAYLTGQLIAEGSTTDNSYEQILEKLYPLAAGYQIRVDREMTVLGGRTHKDNLDTHYKLFTDAYLHPAFKEQDFERVKSNTLNFLKNTLRYSSDEELGKAALYEFVFEGTGYAHPPDGTVEGVESVTPDDVRSFYGRHYTRDNAVVALGGGFSSELVGRLSGSLEGLPEGRPEPAAAPSPAKFEGRQVVLVSKPQADASISFGFPIDVRRGEKDFYALWIANSWLGEHRNSSSHLYQVIREKRGMNYGDYSYIEAYPGGGFRSTPPTNVGRRKQLFEVWIRTLPNQDAQFALRAAMREVQSLIDNGMTKEQFELTRDFLKKYILHFAETTSDRLGYSVDDRFYGIDTPGHLERFQQMLDELTLEDVNAAVKKHLQYEDVKIAIVTGEAEKLKQALASDAPSPKSYPSEKPADILGEDKLIAGFKLGIPEENIHVVPVDSMFQN